MTKRFLRLFPICVLLCLTSCTGRSDHWLSLLEQAEEMNRNDVPFTSDSLGLALVRHYDHWWHSPHLRLRAYYMLGSAYRDAGEAPAALHYYNIATEQVDTAHADSAIYATLFRVYGQMAMIYRVQNLPREQLDALSAFSHYAWLAKDTLSYIRGIEFMITPYFEMDDTLQALQYTEKAKSLFLKYGYIQNAASVYPTAIYISLINGNIARAREYMEIFENESGLFDEHGNIEAGREHYYHSKGLYYTQVGLLDSAEYFYRKLQSFNYSLEACEGLLNVYKTKGITDSIVNYAALYKTMQEQWEATRQSEAIILSSALYDYTRNQNIAERKEKDARISHQIIMLLCTCLLIICLLIYLGYKHYNERRLEKEIKYQKLIEEHLKTQAIYQEQRYKLSKLQQEYEKSKQDIAISNQNNSQTNTQLEKYRQEIARLSSHIHHLQAQSLENMEKLRNDNIVVLFKDMSELKWNRKKPTKGEWEKLIKTYKRHLPHIYAKMEVSKLSRQELFISILSHLDFSTSDLIILLNTSKQTVSNGKLNANTKMFDERSASSLVQNLKKCTYL